METKSSNHNIDKSYSSKIKEVVKLIKHTDAMVVGIGAGMSASGGINYGDPKLAGYWFPEYVAMGFHSILEIQSIYWNISSENVLAYWGYWARHINFIRYQTKLLEPYKHLEKIINQYAKSYFICTTNADGQTQKADLNRNRIFAPQGNYDSFQCSIPCKWDTLYYNKFMIKDMVEHINERHEIPAELIPRCPHCGNYLIPNLRCDDKFVEEPNMTGLADYEAFLSSNLSSSSENILFLELGVGFNTPGIIRYPFEQMTYNNPNAHLIRINKGMAKVPTELDNQASSIDGDINTVLSDLVYELSL